MAEIAVTCVLAIIHEFLLHEAKHLPDLRCRIEVIQLKLRQLQSILEIADTMQETSKGIRVWIAETREVAYDIEDLLLVALNVRKRGRLVRRLSRLMNGFTDVDQRFQVLEAKVNSLESDLRVRNIRHLERGVSNPVSKNSRRLRRTYSHYGDEFFVGLDDDVKDIVSKLVDDEKDAKVHHVVSITGMGGIGKTTVARKVYHHGRVRRYFDAFAWVCVSQEWKQKSVLQRILSKLEPDKKKRIDKMKIDELVEELYRVQRTKKCLILLDDVWQKDVWDLLKPAFHHDVQSKVLLTTRNKDIARYVGKDHSCYHYQQRHLNEQESWELLKKKVKRGLEDTGELEKLGKEMIRQCGGLPLAIIVLGGLLMTRTTTNEWRKVQQDLRSYSRGEKSSHESGRIHEVLALSYNDLPYKLKPCFLHLGNFPEDLKIPTWKLYQLWAAEGFISAESYQDNEEPSIMDTAEQYLEELVQRSMVEGIKDEATGRFKSCRLHDLTRELCLVKGKEENFMKKFPIRYEPQLVVAPSSPRATIFHATRRLSVSVDCDFDSYFPPKKENMKHIRSAMFIASRLNSEKENLQSTLNWICNEVKLLRTLDLENFDFGQKLTNGIGNLVHLKYLGFRGSKFYELSSSIGNLRYLQTLDLRVPSSVCMEVPNVIQKLKNLKYLYLPPTHRCTTKLQLSNLSKLEILKNFNSSVSDYKDILKLTNLLKLGTFLDLKIDNLEALNNYLQKQEVSNHMRESSFHILYNFDSKRELSLLRKLVGYTHLCKMDLVGAIYRLPEHSQFAPSLTKLTLRNSRLQEDPMFILENLHNLHCLKLRKNAYEGKEIRCSSGGFPQLRILELCWLSRLEKWIMEEGAMPNLQCLWIDHCVNLTALPRGIRLSTTLGELVLANMPDEFMRRVHEVNEEAGESTSRREPIITIITTPTGMKQPENESSGTLNPGILRTIPTRLVPRTWQSL